MGKEQREVKKGRGVEGGRGMAGKLRKMEEQLALVHYETPSPLSSSNTQEGLLYTTAVPVCALLADRIRQR